MKGYKRYVFGSVLAGFLAFVLMAPAGSAEAFWGFGKSKKENNANYTGAVVNTKNEGMSQKPSITVVSPNGGEVWKAGTKKNIVFKGNLIKEPVDILLNWPGNSVLIGDIVTSKRKKETYSWAIPATLEQRNDYKVSVYYRNVIYNNNNIKDESDEFFSIVAKNSFPKIVKSPIVSDDIKVGQTVDLVWTATDADNDDLAWSVDFGDGTGLGIDCENPHFKNRKNWEMLASHSWSKKGVYGVHAVVKDCVSGSDKDAFDINIENL